LPRSDAIAAKISTTNFPVTRTTGINVAFLDMLAGGVVYHGRRDLSANLSARVSAIAPNAWAGHPRVFSNNGNGAR